MQDQQRPAAALSLVPPAQPGGAITELTHRAIAGRRIEEKHREFAAELGAPTREITTSGAGYVRTFERGLICCQGVEPFAVYGVIYEKYAGLGRESGLLGFPSSDQPAPGSSLISHFERGLICWTPTTGAHEVHGDILALWERLGAQHSYLGWPLTDELPRGRGRVSFFERGCIAWSAEGGAIDIPDFPESSPA